MTISEVKEGKDPNLGCLGSTCLQIGCLGVVKTKNLRKVTVTNMTCGALGVSEILSDRGRASGTQH
jgi:hypothetical protein